MLVPLTLERTESNLFTGESRNMFRIDKTNFWRSLIGCRNETPAESTEADEKPKGAPEQTSQQTKAGFSLLSRGCVDRGPHKALGLPRGLLPVLFASQHAGEEHLLEKRNSSIISTIL